MKKLFALIIIISFCNAVKEIQNLDIVYKVKAMIQKELLLTNKDGIRLYDYAAMSVTNILPIIYQESWFDGNTNSEDNCKGYGQIHPDTLKTYNWQNGTSYKLKHLLARYDGGKINIKICVWYFKICLRYSRGNLALAYSYYYAGIHSTVYWSGYVDAVMYHREELIRRGVYD